MRPIMSSQFGQALRKRLEKEKDPILRRNLEVVATHLESEVRGDLEAIMATMAPEPHYRFYGAMDDIGMPSEIKGLEATRAMYIAQLEIGGLLAQESVDEIIVVDKHTVAIECFARTGMPGKLLMAAGVKNVRPEVLYLFEGHTACFMPIDDEGRIRGEIVYSDPQQGMTGIENRPLGEGDVVPFR